MHIIKAENRKIEEHEWGRLEWFASGEQGSTAMTIGQCIIKPGCSNDRHFHPNCEEILYVLEGEIEHTYTDGKTIKLKKGDTIIIPANVMHNATNIGKTDSVTAIAFSAAFRKSTGE